MRFPQMSQKLRQLQVDNPHILAQTITALIVADTVSVAVSLFFFQKIER
jgi:hypothetical protein